MPRRGATEARGEEFSASANSASRSLSFAAAVQSMTNFGLDGGGTSDAASTSAVGGKADLVVAHVEVRKLTRFGLRHSGTSAYNSDICHSTISTSWACVLSNAHVERQLAAILAADVAGYRRLVGAEEEGALADLKCFKKSSSIPKSLSIVDASSRPPGAAVAIRDVRGHRRSAEIQRQEHGELAREPVRFRIVGTTRL